MPPRALATLVVREPRGLVRRLPLDGSPVVIGRDAACDVVLDDRRASRRHARIQARGGYLVLSDLGSTNGTYIRSERVSEVTLGLGDSVVIGDSTLELTPVSGDDVPGAPGSSSPDAPTDIP
jgi:pSer/pThr/pTyr-binding forkhead associated (FHA) protein